MQLSWSGDSLSSASGNKAKTRRRRVVFSESRNAGERFNELVVVAVAAFFPLVFFLAMVGN